LSGQDFLRFIQEDDRPAVKAMLSGAGDELDDLQRDSICISLRDAFGIRVCCQMFVARSNNLDGSESFVVGFNELQERLAAHEINLDCTDSAVLPSLPERAVTPTQAPQPQQLGRPTVDKEPSPRSLSHESLSESSHQLSETSQQPGIPKCVFFCVATGDILECTQGFYKMTSGCRQIDLVWAEPLDFRDWLDDTIGEICQGNLATPAFRSYGPHPLRTQRKKRKHSHCRPMEAVLEVCFAPLEGWEPTEYSVSGRVTSKRFIRDARPPPQKMTSRPLPQQKTSHTRSATSSTSEASEGSSPQGRRAQL